MAYNKVILVGRICQEITLKYTPSGIAVCSFRLAVDRDYKPKEGEEKPVDFIDIVAWRQTAEFINTYLGKGRLILVDGELQVRQWQTPEGQNRRNTEVVANKVKTLDRRPDGQQQGQPGQSSAPPSASASGGGEEFDGVPDITDPFADM